MRYVLALVAMTGSIAVLYLAPLVTRGAIDGIVRRDADSELPRWLTTAAQAFAGRLGDGQVLALAGITVLLLTAVSGLLSFIRGRWCAIASEGITRRLRERLFDHLQHLPCSYYDKAQTGDLVQRCTSDVEMVRGFFAAQLMELGRAAVLVLTALPILIMLDWRMTLAATALLPLLAAFAALFFLRIQKTYAAMNEAEGAMTSTLQENLTGIRLVRAFARQDFETARFAERNARHRDLNTRLFTITALYWASSDLLCFSQLAVVLFAGAWRVSTGDLSIGSLVAFLTYVGMMIWPVRQAGRILSDLGKTMVSFRRLREILSQPREDAGHGGARKPRRLKGKIAFKDVCFSYGEKRVLEHVTLNVRPGETVAILGPSGSGKTTLINLLLRFYDCDRGCILLDGHELRQLDRKALRSQIAVVMQEPFLYSRTLRDNIKLGRHDADDPEMIEAATMACIHDSIERFDQRYDTLVGERGVTLSGGQRQRVAIARALLKDAPILVLDDALSAVDTRTESLILRALRRRRGRRTTLVVAHRLSTLIHADRIVVLDHGRIVQCGAHEQLVRQRGLYRRLWQMQGEAVEQASSPDYMKISRADTVDDAA